MTTRAQVIDIGAACAYVAGPALTILSQQASATWPNSAKQIAFYVGVVIFVAGLISRLFANRTDAPATSIVQNALVVPAPVPESLPADPTAMVVKGQPQSTADKLSKAGIPPPPAATPPSDTLPPPTVGS